MTHEPDFKGYIHDIGGPTAKDVYKRQEKNVPVEQQRLEKEQIEDMGSVYRTRGAHAIHCLTVIGQVEGHVEAPQGQKTTKYEHVIPQLVAVQEDPAIEGLLVLLNTVGGDVEGR